jgi:NAD(P)-dependent dehydrogenase (short-subunit alcohol dehydrogenase family)
MDLLSGRVAIVTGASRGIGAAIARLFAKEGAKVAVHGRDSAALSAVRAGIEREGGIATQVVADVTKFSEIEAMRRQVEQTVGPIDILVANAGGSFTKPGPLEEISEEGWHASVNGNLTATLRLSEKCEREQLKFRSWKKRAEPVVVKQPQFTRAKEPTLLCNQMPHPGVAHFDPPLAW